MDKPVSSGIVTLSSGDLTEGGGFQILAKQEKKPVLSEDGSILGYTFFEIDENNRRVEKFITSRDNYVMDLSAYLKYVDGLGGSSYDTDNGGLTVSGLTPELARAASTGDIIRTNESWGKYVSSTPFDNIARGPGANEAVRAISRTVFENLTQSGMVDLAFGLDANGNLVVRNEDVAFRETGILASDILDMFNSNGGTQFKDELSMEIARVSRGVDGEGYAQMGAAPELFATPGGGRSLTPTPAQASERMARGYIAASEQYDNRNLQRTFGTIEPEKNPFYFGGLGLTGQSLIAAQAGPSPDANPFTRQETLARAQLRLPSEMAASPYTRAGITPASGPALDSSYAFRYAGGTQLDAGLPKADTSFKGTSLSSGLTDSRPPAQAIRFTPQQVSQSLVDFRAGERQSLNISTSTSTTGGR